MAGAGFGGSVTVCLRCDWTDTHIHTHIHACGRKGTFSCMGTTCGGSTLCLRCHWTHINIYIYMCVCVCRISPLEASLPVLVLLCEFTVHKHFHPLSNGYQWQSQSCDDDLLWCVVHVCIYPAGRRRNALHSKSEQNPSPRRGDGGHGEDGGISPRSLPSMQSLRLGVLLLIVYLILQA